MATSSNHSPLNDPLLYAQNLFELSVPTLGVQLGYFTQVSGLTGSVDVTEYAEGGVNDFVHKLPTRIKYGNLTLKRGLTDEHALLYWFQSSVIKAALSPVTLTLLDQHASKVQAWAFADAYPVKWTGTDLNAGGTEMMTESLEIAHHGISVP
jgi:phage tail-like protein